MLPNLVVSDRDGRIFDIPSMRMAGMSLNRPVLSEEKDLIPLPYGSDLFVLPERTAIGYEPRRSAFQRFVEHRGEPVFPVAAFMAPAYLQIQRCAFDTPPHAKPLSLYSYTSVGWRRGRFWVAGTRIDSDRRQDPSLVDHSAVRDNAGKIIKRYPKNRLVRHLVENCVFRYGCPAARNFVMERWECPVPVSPSCDARCVGCISYQRPEAGFPPSQQRLCFTPTVEEILEFTVPHLERASRAVISFGQGCEGEPLLEGELLEESIREIRRRTSKGVINLNTNAGRPRIVERLCAAGLDSIRVSLNSAQSGLYQSYHRPSGFSFQEVLDSLSVVRRYRRWSSLNYFIFPGLTDHPLEISALGLLISRVKPNMIQTRNLNMDPQVYIEALNLQGYNDGGGIGMRNWIRTVQRDFPWLKLGYFNPPREEMGVSYFQFQ